jgi:hypothetical protein
MITLTREEAQQVLDDLEALTAYIQGIDKGIVLKTQSIETLCARLSTPEPEPVAWMNEGDIGRTDWKVWAHGKPTATIPLYPAPPQREEGCAECGKKSSDGWALYCVKCSEISEPDQDDGVCGNCNGDGCKFCDARFLLQREWQGLTDDEVKEIYRATEMKVEDHWRTGGTTMMFPTAIYQAIEQALQEKNT